MPRRVALIALTSGAAVAAFGVLLQAIGLPPAGDEVSMPLATLEPVDEGGTGGGAAPSQRSGDAKGVRGTVVTTEGEAVSGVSVTLHPLFMEKGVESVTDTTDGDGNYSFADVRVDPGSPWIAEARFDGVRFPSAVLRAPRGKQRPLKLVVAETTKRATDVEVRVESLAIVGDDSGAQAVHALTVTNGGKRAYVGGVRLPLLRTATSIQEGTGLDRRYLSVEHGQMVSTAPVLPGSHDLTYTYVVQMSRSGVEIDRSFALPTKRYELLVGARLSLVRNTQLDDDGTVTLGARDDPLTYRRFVARDLAPKDRVRGTIEVATGPNVLRLGIPIAAIAIALLVVLVPLLRRRRPEERPEPAPEHTSAPA